MRLSSTRFDAWIHDTFRVDETGLALYRIAYAGFALFVIAPGHDSYTDLVSFAGLPDAMFAPPPGPMALFTGFPPTWLAYGILLLLNLSLAGLLVGYRTRTAALATGLLFLVVYGFSYSLGKINHNILFVLVPIIMAGSGWGGALSYDALYRIRREARSWPLTLLAVIIAFAMFTAGFAKLLGGWLDPSTQASYGHLLKHFHVRGRTDLLAPYAVNMDSGFVWEALDYLTVLFELAFIAAVARARSIRLFVALAVVFHFGIMMALNISFHFNLIAYAAFADWTKMGRIVRRRLPTIEPTRTIQVALPAAAAFLGFVFFAAGSPLLWLDWLVPIQSDLLAREVLILIIATTLVVYVGIRDGILWLYGVKYADRLPITV